jgi:3-hydroxyisobutyryl-CoA hydrolase
MLARCRVMMQSVLFSHERCAKVITLNRPKALNSLDVGMVELMLPEYRALHQLPHHSVVVIMKGSGEKAFCAGGDVVSIVKDEPAGTRQRFFYREYQLDYSIMTLKQPHVALWDGIVMGGGVGVSVHGSHRVASPKAVFAMPETAIGLFPDVGGSWFLPRLPHDGLGLFLALTGQRLKGADLVHAGIATHYVGPDRMVDLERALCGIDSHHQPVNTQLVNSILDSFTPDAMPEFSLAAVLPQIKALFSPAAVPTIETLLQTLERDGSDWALKQLSILKKCSPTSLKLSLRLHKKGGEQAMTPRDVFAMEYFASQRLMELPDFRAGVTALLIDKTGAPPVWSPQSLGEVTEELVESCLRATSPATPLWHPEGDFPNASKL